MHHAHPRTQVAGSHESRRGLKHSLDASHLMSTVVAGSHESRRGLKPYRRIKLKLCCRRRLSREPARIETSERRTRIDVQPSPALTRAGAD